MTKLMSQSSSSSVLTAEITDELAWEPSLRADRINASVADGVVTLTGQVETYPEKDQAVRVVLRVRGVKAVADEIAVQVMAAREDVDIAREVSYALDQTVFVPEGTVKAVVRDHVVTLSGTLAWQHERVAAGHAVGAIPGVRGVRNDITLLPLSAPSAQAKAGLVAAMVRHARLDAQHVQVEIDEGTVRLQGTVASWDERREAEQAAWSTPGVTYVDNLLKVSP